MQNRGVAQLVEALEWLISPATLPLFLVALLKKGTLINSFSGSANGVRKSFFFLWYYIPHGRPMERELVLSALQMALLMSRPGRRSAHRD